MKKTLLLSLLLCLPVGLMAQQVKVKRISHPTIKVAGKVVKVNDYIDINATIEWPSDSMAYMKVYTLEQPPKPLLLTAHYMRQHNLNTCRQFINSSNLYTRSVMQSRPSDTLYLVDTLYIPRAVGGKPDAEVELRWGGGKSVPLTLSADGKNYVVVRSRLGALRSGAVQVEIWEKESGYSVCCYRGLYLIILPR